MLGRSSLSLQPQNLEAPVRELVPEKPGDRFIQIGYGDYLKTSDDYSIYSTDPENFAPPRNTIIHIFNKKTGQYAETLQVGIYSEYEFVTNNQILITCANQIMHVNLDTREQISLTWKTDKPYEEYRFTIVPYTHNRTVLEETPNVFPFSYTLIQDLGMADGGNEGILEVGVASVKLKEKKAEQPNGLEIVSRAFFPKIDKRTAHYFVYDKDRVLVMNAGALRYGKINENKIELLPKEPLFSVLHTPSLRIHFDPSPDGTKLILGCSLFVPTGFTSVKVTYLGHHFWQYAGNDNWNKIEPNVDLGFTASTKITWFFDSCQFATLNIDKDTRTLNSYRFHNTVTLNNRFSLPELLADCRDTFQLLERGSLLRLLNGHILSEYEIVKEDKTINAAIQQALPSCPTDLVPIIADYVRAYRPSFFLPANSIHTKTNILLANLQRFITGVSTNSKLLEQACQAMTPFLQNSSNVAEIEDVLEKVKKEVEKIQDQNKKNLVLKLLEELNTSCTAKKDKLNEMEIEKLDAPSMS